MSELKRFRRICPCPAIGEMHLLCAVCGKVGDAYYMFADHGAEAGTFVHDSCTGLGKRDPKRYFSSRHLVDVPNVS